MDDHPSLATSVSTSIETRYQCPGESYTISRAVHLGRLAAFYPACQGCTHRQDVSGLAPLQIAQWEEVLRRPNPAPVWTPESLSGATPGAMTPAIVRQFAAALGVAVRRDSSPRSTRPTVLIGAGGHWSAAELVAVACETLAWSGCRAVDLGAVSSAALAVAAQRVPGDAGLWIGNSSGAPHAIDLKAWGPAGAPWSSPGGLDRVREIHQHPVDRPQRGGGGSGRASIDEDYVRSLRSLFHALRPLRFVVDTTCQPLLRYLNELVSQAACRVMLPAQVSSPLESCPDAESWLQRRVRLVSQAVVAADAHFGIWMSGDGEACRLVDEAGVPVESSQLLLLLTQVVCRQRPAAAIVLERESAAALDAAIERMGGRVVRSDASRQAMSRAIKITGAMLGGGPSGRFWFSGEPAAPDALLTLSLLLTLLSESDRPLSEVLDEFRPPVYKGP